MSQNWSSFSLEGFVTPSIGIFMKCMYSVVDYISNKRPWTSVCQIDLELQLVLWKQLCVLFKKKEKWTKVQIYSFTSSSLSVDIHVTFFFSKYRLFAATHAFILSTHFFNGSFKLFLGMHSKIVWVSWITWASCFEVLAM